MYKKSGLSRIWTHFITCPIALQIMSANNEVQIQLYTFCLLFGLACTCNSHSVTLHDQYHLSDKCFHISGQYDCKREEHLILQ